MLVFVDLSSWAGPAATIALVVGVIAVAAGTLWSCLWFKRRAELSLERIYEGLEIHSVSGPGLVAVVFHTYHGFVAFVEQTEHRFWATPSEAREALRRLNRFNLRWGMLAYGALFIPLISYANYLAQRRSVRKQEIAMGEAD
jgi:hypothetical protein